MEYFNIIIQTEDGPNIVTTKGESILIDKIKCFKHFTKTQPVHSRCTITNAETGFIVSTAQSYEKAIILAYQNLRSPKAEASIQKVRDFLKERGFTLPINE